MAEYLTQEEMDALLSLTEDKQEKIDIKLTKLEKTIHYISHVLENNTFEDRNIINKILLLSDLEKYERDRISITGINYIKLPHELVPHDIEKAFNNLKKMNIVRVKAYTHIVDTYEFVSLEEPDYDSFSALEIFILGKNIRDFIDSDSEKNINILKDTSIGLYNNGEEVTIDEIFIANNQKEISNYEVSEETVDTLIEMGIASNEIVIKDKNENDGVYCEDIGIKRYNLNSENWSSIKNSKWMKKKLPETQKELDITFNKDRISDTCNMLAEEIKTEEIVDLKSIEISDLVNDNKGYEKNSEDYTVVGFRYSYKQEEKIRKYSEYFIGLFSNILNENMEVSKQIEDNNSEIKLRYYVNTENGSNSIVPISIGTTVAKKTFVTSFRIDNLLTEKYNPVVYEYIRNNLKWSDEALEDRNELDKMLCGDEINE